MDNLTEEQQASLNRTKVSMRQTSELYLRSHPELKHLISHFMSQLLAQKPDDTVKFATKYFTNRNLRDIIQKDKENPATFDS